MIYYYHNVGAGLKDHMLHGVSKNLATYGKKIGFNKEQCKSLGAQLRKYVDNREPFNVEFVPNEEDVLTWWSFMRSEKELKTIAEKLFSIVPNSASSERGFSKLGWLCGKHRINLNNEKLESMGKLCTYYKSNAKKVLSFYGHELTTEEINFILRNENIYEDEDEVEDEGENENEENDGMINIEDNEVIVTVEWHPLHLEEIINLNNIPKDYDKNESQISDQEFDSYQDGDMGIYLYENNNNVKNINDSDYDYDPEFEVRKGFEIDEEV